MNSVAKAAFAALLLLLAAPAAAQAPAQAATTKYLPTYVGFEAEAPEGGPPKPPPKNKYRRAL